jgi:hypothetical protein
MTELKHFLGILSGANGTTKVKIAARSLFEAESRFSQIAKQNGKFVEDIMEI